MLVGVAVEDGDGQPAEQDLLELAAGAGSRTHHHHLLPLGISETPLLAWTCQPLFWRKWNDRTEVGSWGLWCRDSPVGRLERWERELRRCIY